MPAAVAGHSLGEYTALVAAGAIGFREAVGLVQKRGQYMAEAVSPGSGLVAAVLGLSESEVFEVCKEAEAIRYRRSGEFEFSRANGDCRRKSRRGTMLWNWQRLVEPNG